MNTIGWLRHPLLHCLLLGSGAFLAQSLLPDPSADHPAATEIHLGAAEVEALKAQWRQQLGRELTPDELQASLQARVDEEILINEARLRGWDRTDPIVRRRLRENLAFTEQPASHPSDALATAYELGMPLQDPVVRKRLLLRMQAELRSQADLEAENAELARYADSATTLARRWNLSHVLRTGPDARAELLSLPSFSPQDAPRYSEPFLAGNVLADISDKTLAKTFGPGFAAQLEALPPGQWAGPVESVFGQHLVWIEATTRQPVPINPAKVYLAWKADQENQALRDGMSQLRQQYTVSWEE
ncbi:hypothetical protein [Alcanivorax sp.]|uniref:foldase protein PrsA n=1 Tax=Alcanivorax sp. TaxID=1872427 RepID=UPI0019AF6757|nr:hypothetical protein [Alcanivorax sp.]MBD3645669.1 hypothetical protein [Alcanivorax sp.]